MVIHLSYLRSWRTKSDTGAKIPSVGLGTWQADPGLIGNAVEAAVKIGYRQIDCALISMATKKRLGLWMFDLAVIQQMQDLVPEPDRCVVGGVQPWRRH
ncbi:PREDICTED: aldo-keto reductase family 4 member C10-like isoform X2 [Camelina sativa]|uniref:Solute carrier family 40 member n=1 Tax=Camelina sativa TaxID=90675 RepID=A0ABM0U4L3_CAMSA|nr:PREDICTED: aldo-keto reductase family 4 member C10-like isoform X2 [Camelina sativa]